MKKHITTYGLAKKTEYDSNERSSFGADLQEIQMMGNILTAHEFAINKIQTVGDSEG